MNTLISKLNEGSSTKSIYFEQPLLSPTNSEDLNFKEKIANILTGAILNSKSPLAQDDPFGYLISKEFLFKFLTFSGMFIFIMVLFE
jgi:hypothetical protein